MKTFDFHPPDAAPIGKTNFSFGPSTAGSAASPTSTLSLPILRRPYIRYGVTCF